MGKEMELLKQTLADHKPYAIIVPETSEDELLHFEMQIFQYQKAENQYQPASHFESMIKASNKATEKFDFAKYKVEKEEYSAQAVTPEAFAKDFFDFLNIELPETGNEFNEILFISVNSKCNDYLKQTGESIATFEDNHIEILDGTEITGDFLKENGGKGYKSTNALHKFLHSDENKPDNTSKGKIALFQEMIERCSESVMELTAEKSNIQPDIQPDLTDIFASVQQETLEETPAPAKQESAAKPSIAFFTPEMEQQIKEYNEYSDRADAERKEAMSVKGKEEYANADMEGKLSKYSKMPNKMNEEAVLNGGDCAYNLFCQVANGTYMMEKEGESNGDAELVPNKGFTVIHVGTTGFGAKGITELDSQEDRKLKQGGFPMQVSISTWEVTENGELKAHGSAAFRVKADERALQEAIQQADIGKFDTFQHGGLNREEYLALWREGKNNNNAQFYTQEGAVRGLLSYLEERPLEEYPVVTAFPQGVQALKLFEKEVTDEKTASAFRKTFPEIDKAIDFNQVIKEYSLAASKLPEYAQENSLFPDRKVPEKFPNFKLATFAEKWGRDITGSRNTEKFVSFLAKNIHEHECEAREVRISEFEKQKQEEQEAVPVQTAEPAYQEDIIEQPSFFNSEPEITEPKTDDVPKKEIPDIPLVPEQKEILPEEQTIPQAENPQMINPAPEVPPMQNSADFLQQSSSLVGEYQAQTQQLQQQFQQQQAAMQSLFPQPSVGIDSGKFDQMLQLLTVIANNSLATTQGINALAKKTSELENRMNQFQDIYIKMGNSNLQNQMQANNLLQKTVENGVQQIQQGSQTISIQKQQLQQSAEINQNQQSANQKTEQVLAEVKGTSNDTHELAVSLTQLLGETIELHKSDSEIRQDMSSLTGALEHTTQSVSDMTQKIVSVDMEGKETKAALEETAQMAKETKAEVAEHRSSIEELKASRKTIEAKLEHHDSLISSIHSSVKTLTEKRTATDKALREVVNALGEEESRISDTRSTLKNVLEETKATRETVDKVTNVVLDHEERLNLHEDVIMGGVQKGTEYAPPKPSKTDY